MTLTSRPPLLTILHTTQRSRPQELSDVLLYLLRISDKAQIDLSQAALDKLSLNAAKYPAKLVKGSSKKYNEY